MSEENKILVREDDLPILSFLPVWMYHYICLDALGRERVRKTTLLRALEAHTEDSYPGITGFLISYLKTNVHKLFEYHYKDLEKPDFSHLEADLVSGLDLLQTNGIEQPAFQTYQTMLIGLSGLFATDPRVDGKIEASAQVNLQVRAKILQKMLAL
ncbi:MAG TPA: hypothetical protein VLM37_09405 [Fibrobacteraceae bacterium]|nr:hypothetical protein [Fibrobacteraceae bacterium]